MRNLELRHCVHVCDSPELAESSHSSVDYDTGILYTATKASAWSFDPKSAEVVHNVSLYDGGHLPAEGEGHIVSIQHLPDQMSVCIATSIGDVLLWAYSSDQVECVGSVESGIRAMAWSPDQELVVLVTGQDTIIMMTREFDPLTEMPIHTEEFGEAQPITVGWGKKETQFHGSEGKTAAQQKSQPVKPAFAWDDMKARISWRGDGQYFTVSTIHPGTGARQLRVWSREGALHSTSENVDGIEQALAWKPSGSLIATSQRRPNKHNIVFFEKNGLTHGEFTLPFPVNQVQVLELLWNIDSTVLAVWCQDLLPEACDSNYTPKSYVQLWTVGNYHWYLKQSLQFPAVASDRLTTVLWDPEHAYRMHIVCAGGQYLQYTWSWTTSSSAGQTAEDQALVAVSNGEHLLLTPFRHMVVPPPMSAYTLQMASPVNQVAFGMASNCNDFAALLADGRVAFYTFSESGKDCLSVKLDAAGGSGFKACCDKPSLKYVLPITNFDSDDSYPLKAHHLTWLTSDAGLLLCSLNMMGSASVVHRAEVDDQEQALVIRESHEVEGFVYGVAVHPVSGTTVLQLTDGTLLQYTKDLGIHPFPFPNCDHGRFPLPCTQMAVTTLDEKEVVIGLTERFRFYVNDQEVANNCTSFVLHDDFLVLTTHAHTARCISRKTPLTVLPTLCGDKSHPFDESVRRVERGSRAVCVVGDDTKLVLQMPRGNIEAIHPRALVLATVRKYLDRLEFGQAFILMRKHRINMNLLYDHSPKAFMDNVDTFIKEVAAVNHINLFLSDLIEEDVTQTMYTAAYPQQAVNTASDKPSDKVDTVCNAVCAALEAADADKYLLCILTAYVRKINPELEKALTRINSLQGVNNPSVSAEEALAYLVFLVDVNELYDVALGTYDFNLVLMVADKSQKDPKEYLPFLNELRRLEENYQRYSIDKHLKRYCKALKHISYCGTSRFSECMSLVKEQRLYREALKLYSVSSQEYKDIAHAYGDYLSEKKHYEEAGLMYMQATEWQAALDAFTKCQSWRHAMCMTKTLQYNPSQTAQLARSIAGELVLKRRHQEAACLLEQYAQDIEEAIDTLIKGAVWEEALRLMYLYDRTDFIETDLKSALVDNANNHIELLGSIHADILKYSQRLVVVRQNKEMERLEMLEGGDQNVADADLFSDTSSATGISFQSSKYSSYSTNSQRSNMSSASGRSGKSRRKSNRKRWSMKEGSAHEDFALIDAIAKLIRQTEESKVEVGALLRMLVLFHHEELATNLQTIYGELLLAVEKVVPEVWDSTQNDSTNPLALGPQSTANSIAQAMMQGVQSTTAELPDPVIRHPPVVTKDSSWKVYDLTTSASK